MEDLEVYQLRSKVNNGNVEYVIETNRITGGYSTAVEKLPNGPDNRIKISRINTNSPEQALEIHIWVSDLLDYVINYA